LGAIIFGRLAGAAGNGEIAIAIRPSNKFIDDIR
jgi:hypothetical protein